MARVIRYAGNEFFKRMVSGAEKRYAPCKILRPFEREYMGYVIFILPIIMWGLKENLCFYEVGVTYPPGLRGNRMLTAKYRIIDGVFCTIIDTLCKGVYTTGVYPFDRLPRELRAEVLKSLIVGRNNNKEKRKKKRIFIDPIDPT